MRGRRLRWALAGLAVVIAVLTSALLPQPNRVTAANICRIHKGMTRNEVEAILGSPGDYSTGPIVYEMPALGGGIDWVESEDAFDGLKHFQIDARWAGDEGTIAVNYEFNQPPTVCIVDAAIHKRKPQRLLDNFVWRAKRQWHRWLT